MSEQQATHYARCPDGIKAVEVVSVPEGFTIADCFYVDLLPQFFPCPPDLAVGSTRDAQGNWTAPPAEA